MRPKYAAVRFLHRTVIYALPGGAKLLAEVENMAAMQSFTVGGSGGMLPHEILVILGVLRRI